MAFTLPTLREVWDLGIAALRGRIPTANVSRHADIAKRMYAVALSVTDLFLHQRAIGKELFPDTAPDDGPLDRHGRIRGVIRKGAVGASKASGLRVFGDVGATVPSGEALTHTASGLQFQTASGGTIPSAGYLDVDVEAVSTGEQTNLETGEELQFDSTPADLEQVCRLVLDLEGGLDREDAGPYRTRILNRWQEPAAGGNRNDWEQWLLESENYVAYGYVLPGRNGAGTVDLVALKDGSGSERLLDSGERTAVDGYVDDLRPVSATQRVLEVTEDETDVEVRVLPVSDPAYAFDWTDATPMVVATWTAGTRTLTFSADRPSSMAVGHRLIIDNAASDGVEHVIEALSGTDAVVLEEAPSFTPTASDNVYSGGPLVQPARLAILALIDELGPANESSQYGPWEGTLRTSSLFETVQLQDGVLDSDLVAPVANVEATDPAYPDNDTIGLITPGKVLVRRWWP